MNDRSRWIALAALGLLLIVLSNTQFSLFHGGFRLFGFNPLLTAILLAVAIWFLLDRCGGKSTTAPAEPVHTAPMADVDPEAFAGDDDAADKSPEHENGEDADKTS